MGTITCSMWYKGKNYDSGSYRVLACNITEDVSTHAHLCIHPTTHQLGFFQNSTFTPFATDAIINDDTKYHICLMMENGLASLRLNGKLKCSGLSMFSEDTYPINKIGNYYPSEMSFKRGLAPSASLVPSAGTLPIGDPNYHPRLAPSNTILSNTTHANGWIDEVRMYDRILSADDVEGIIYHTLLKD